MGIDILFGVSIYIMSLIILNDDFIRNVIDRVFKVKVKEKSNE